MTSTTFAPAFPVQPYHFLEWLPWAIFAGLICLLAIYFVGAEEGATSLVRGMYVHEFVHDGRHLLGFPCHYTELATMVGKLLVRGMLAGIAAGLLTFGFEECRANRRSTAL